LTSAKQQKHFQTNVPGSRQFITKMNYGKKGCFGAKKIATLEVLLFISAVWLHF